MGTDINFYVEKKVRGKWELVPPPKNCRRRWHMKWEDDEYHTHDWVEAEEKRKDGKPYYIDYNDFSWDIGRNYNLFAQLANVRNGSGFAGCDIGDGFSPIDEPRGIPEDASQETKEILEDYHSCSHILLKELLEYPVKDLYTNLRGIIGIYQYVNWRKSPPTWPESWCGGVGGEVLTREQADAYLEENELPPVDPKDISPFGYISGEKNVKVEWSATYYECASMFWDKIVSGMQGQGKPEEVRAVFGFDS